MPMPPPLLAASRRVVPRSARRRFRCLGAGLVLLALWVQALAPSAALRMALAGSDLLPGTVLCGHVAGSSAIGASVEPTSMPPGCEVCRLCRAGLSPPPLPSSPAPARALRWIAVAWPVPPPSHSGPPPRCVGQPRAPPAVA